MIVADTNLIAYLLLPGDRTDEARAVFSVDADWAAPLLWRSELRNVLATYVRGSRLSLEDAVVLMEDAVVLMDGREYAVPSERVLRAVGDAPAGDEGASACDAEFAVLSRDLGVPLVTVDGRALRSFPDVAVSPEAFLA